MDGAGAVPRRGLWLALALTFLVCLPTFWNGFAQDGKQLAMVDGNEAAANPMVATLQPLASYFESHYWKGAGVESNLYRPVTVLSFAVVRAWLGPLVGEAFAQHLVDVLLHLTATLLVAILLGRLRAPPAACVLGTLVFGIHAVHAEAITSVVGRAEILGFCAGLGATFVGSRAESAPLGRCCLWTLLAALLLFLGAASKESALAWVVMAPLLLRTLAAPRAAAAVFVGGVAAASLFLLLRHHALAPLERPLESALVNPLLDAPAGTRIATASVVLVYGLGKLALPRHLVSDYGGETFALHTSWLAPAPLVSAFVLLGLLAATWWARRRERLLWIAGAAFLGFSLPTANLAFPTGTIFAERLLYTPSLACSLVAAWLLQRFPRPPWRTAVLVASGTWLAASAWWLVTRLPDWKDEATLHLRDAQANPRATRLQMAAGEELYGRGALAGAIEFTRRATELDPEAAGAWNNLGSMLLDARDPTQAELALRRGLLAKRRSEDETRMLRLNLARSLHARGDRAAALAELEALRQAAPDFVPALLVSLDVAAETGAEGLVEALWKRGEELAPRAPPWALHRGLAGLRRGDLAVAERELEAVVRAGYERKRAEAALAEVRARRARLGR